MARIQVPESTKAFLESLPSSSMTGKTLSLVRILKKLKRFSYSHNGWRGRTEVTASLCSNETGKFLEVAAWRERIGTLAIQVVPLGDEGLEVTNKMVDQLSPNGIKVMSRTVCTDPTTASKVVFKDLLNYVRG